MHLNSGFNGDVVINSDKCISTSNLVQLKPQSVHIPTSQLLNNKKVRQ